MTKKIERTPTEKIHRSYRKAEIGATAWYIFSALYTVFILVYLFTGGAWYLGLYLAFPVLWVFMARTNLIGAAKTREYRLLTVKADEQFEKLHNDFLRQIEDQHKK